MARTTLPRWKVISLLKQELHVHNHSNGWYIVSHKGKNKLCDDKEKCIHVMRERGDKVDKL